MQTEEARSGPSDAGDLASDLRQGYPALNLEIEYVDPHLLRPSERMTRAHSKKQIREIAESISSFGPISPLIVDRERRILAGHGRWEAAKLLGLPTVPVVSVDHLSDLEKRAFSIADNKIAENAGWDLNVLAIELAELTLELPTLDLNIAVTGFSLGELDKIDHDRGPRRPDPSDRSPPRPDNPVSRFGDIWSLGDHRVMCGDTRSEDHVRRLMGNERARVIFTDPPYNVRIAGHVQGRGQHAHREFDHACGEMTSSEFMEFLAVTLGNLAAVCLDGAIVYACMDWRHIGEMTDAGGKVFTELKNIAVWVKSSPGQGSFYRSQHELVFIFKVGTAPHLNSFGLGEHGRLRSNVWNYPGVNSFGRGRKEALSMHPTVKPAAMVMDALRDCTQPGDVVLDGFLGSGTTIIAAESLGRRGYGMEFDPGYVDVVIARWQAMTKREATLEGDGRTFEEIAVARALEAVEPKGEPVPQVAASNVVELAKRVPAPRVKIIQRHSAHDGLHKIDQATKESA